jgi:adenine phosphoribosyltransferase
MMTSSEQLRAFIRDVPDFPKPGVVFKDITPLLRSPEALDRTMEWLAEPFRDQGITNVVAIESRGFIFGSCVARALNAGFVPIRKPGKLPWTRRRHEYVLEYGTDTLEIHDDALTADDRVLIVDDVLATGGTAAAAAALVRGFDAQLVGIAAVIELSFLEGRRKLGGNTKIHTLLQY